MNKTTLIFSPAALTPDPDLLPDFDAFIQCTGDDNGGHHSLIACTDSTPGLLFWDPSALLACVDRPTQKEAENMQSSELSPL